MAKHEHDQARSQQLSRWVHEHGRAVLGYLRAMTGDSHLADDLLQETYARAWSARERYRDEQRERGYLLRIADRLVRDGWRRRRPDEQMSDQQWELLDPADVTTGTPPEQMSQAEAAAQLALAMGALSEPQRRTLLMRYYGDMSFREIAEATEMPLSTVLSHGRRGLTALRRLLVEKTPCDE